MERIDRKFNISAHCLEHGHQHDQFDAMLFLAKDRALVPMLHHYRQLCESLGAEQRQLNGVDLLIGRVVKWQAEHPQLLKVADIDDTEMGRQIIRPNEEGKSNG